MFVRLRWKGARVFQHAVGREGAGPARREPSAAALERLAQLYDQIERATERPKVRRDEAGLDLLLRKEGMASQMVPNGC